MFLPRGIDGEEPPPPWLLFLLLSSACLRLSSATSAAESTNCLRKSARGGGPLAGASSAASAESGSYLAREPVGASPTAAENDADIDEPTRPVPPTREEPRCCPAATASARARTGDGARVAREEFLPPLALAAAAIRRRKRQAKA